MKKIKTLIGIAFCFATLLAFVGPALASTPNLSADPLLRLKPGSNAVNSLNWGGYAETPNRGSVTSVTGTFTVPTVTNNGGSTDQFAAFWAGIDGYNSQTVEQAGVLAYAPANGLVQYSAWYEFYPQQAIQTIQAINVNPTDSVTVSVAVSSKNTFTITLTDNTESFTTSKTVMNAATSSAEWIVERPSVGGTLSALANFGTVSFTGCSATATKTLSSPVKITMVDNSLNTLAKVSSTWNSGSFEMQYVAST